MRALPGGAAVASQHVCRWVACRPCTSLGSSSPPKKTVEVPHGASASWGGSHPLPLCCRHRLQHPLWPWLGTESGWRCAGAEYIPLNPSISSLLGDSLKSGTNNVSHWIFSGWNSIQKSRLRSCYHLDCLWIPEPDPRASSFTLGPFGRVGWRSTHTSARRDAKTQSWGKHATLEGQRWTKSCATQMNKCF